MTHQPTLLAPSGVPLRRFGGDGAHRQYETRGYIVSLEWDEDGEPMTVIWPAGGDLNRGAWLVCLSAYPAMIELDGRPTKEGFKMTARGLAAMGREVDSHAIITLFDVALDAYSHLVRVPPRKAVRDTGMFEATALLNGRVFHERSV